MSDIYQVNNEFRRKLLRMERSAASALLREYGRAWSVIRKEIINMNTQYEKSGEISAAAWLYESERLAGLQRQAETEIAKFARYADKVIQEEQKEAVQMAQKGADALLKSSLPNGVKVAFNQLPVEVFQNLVGFLQSGSPLSKLLNELPGEAGKTVADGLKTGLLLGWNPTRTARSIRESLGGNLARALRIARTETLRSYREASRQIFKANDHVVKSWRWASARNERTCAMCWAMDGTEHGLEEQLEEHICGRCSMVPITRSWRELGFDIDEAEGLKPITGMEAFAQLSDTEQLRVLGPAKYAAWKENKFVLSDLVGRKYDPQWGWTRYEKSLKELGLDKTEWLNKYRANPVKEMIPLNDAVDQILALHEKDDGATFSLHYGDMVGKPYRSVSIFPDIGKKMPGKEITKEQLLEFMRNHEGLLRNEKVVIGTWFNPADNRTYLDFSVVIQDRDFAIGLGKRYNQIGIFDLEKMEYIEIGGTGEDFPNLPSLQDRLRDLL